MGIKRLTSALLFIGIAGMVLLSCAPSGSGSGASSAGQAHALKITWRATTDLNWFNERSHTLAFYIVQAKNVKALAKLKKSSDAVLQFLAKDSKQIKDIHDVQRITIQPGGMQSDFLDIAPDTGCVGLIAAYYYLDSTKAVRVFGLPTGADKKMSVDVILGKGGFLKASKTDGGKW